MAKASSDAIRNYLVDAKSKKAIDFGCGTGLVGIKTCSFKQHGQPFHR
jgi:16S rRNA G1207 methylase RsmC